VRTLARQFADVLYEAGFETVVPVKSYELVERSLLHGDVDAAWGPPMVCARVEQAGGAVALRGIRHGSTTYRSVLLCRSHDDLTIDELGRPGLRRLRACWVDRWSMAGCIMPRHHLRSLGIDLEAAFSREEYLGSYEACFTELINCDADITASYANARGIGYVEMCGADAYQLRTLAYTAECPNDGVVVSPSAVQRHPEIFARLGSLLSDQHKREVLAASLDVDDFEQPPRGSYLGLLNLLPQ
jgi:ABC-type phosphate/phosphonate transport system substrate-binding protein